MYWVSFLRLNTPLPFQEIITSILIWSNTLYLKNTVHNNNLSIISNRGIPVNHLSYWNKYIKKKEEKTCKKMYWWQVLYAHHAYCYLCIWFTCFCFLLCFNKLRHFPCRLQNRWQYNHNPQSLSYNVICKNNSRRDACLLSLHFFTFFFIFF